MWVKLLCVLALCGICSAVDLPKGIFEDEEKMCWSQKTSDALNSTITIGAKDGHIEEVRGHISPAPKCEPVLGYNTLLTQEGSIISATVPSESVQLSPSQSVFTLAVGSALEVNCTVSAGAIDWTADGSRLMGRQFQVRGSVNTDGENVSTLMIGSVTSDDAKTYRCKRVDGDDYGASEASFEVKVFTVTTQNAQFEHNKVAVLTCQVADTSRTYTYSWKKGDVAVDQITVEGKQAFIDFNNGTLEIKHALRKFAGKYTCIAKYHEGSADHTIEHGAYYYATPKVLPFTTPKDVMINTTLMMECKVLGYPLPSISWWKGVENPTNINGGGSSGYKLSPGVHNGMRMENAKLEIERVASNDVGMYMCMATSSMWPGFNSTQTVLVRVNDGTSPSNAVRAGLLSIFIGPCLLLMFLALM